VRARRSVSGVVLAVALLLSAAQAPAWLSPAERVADGVEYFRSTDPTLVDPPGPIAVHLLKLDPARVRLSSVHAKDEIMGLETVDSLAQRHQAIAAVNGGFFSLANGDPSYVLKEAGALVSDSPIVKGAVIIRSPSAGKTDLLFDQLSAHVDIRFKAAGKTWVVPVGGVNTTRARGKLMLYTARYHADTDTAANGIEWALSGKPLRVTAVRRDAGRTPIPRDGSVLSFGGLNPPEGLANLAVGVEVEIATTWRTLNGVSAGHLNDADDIVTGAGLLRVKGRVLNNWQQAENLNPQAFTNMRHPRTIVGLDHRGFIWLAAIDGRQPERSVGMTFADLQRLADRLLLTDALNLDGGGSTTMVIGGKVVNHPSGAVPRPVSDALLVRKRSP